LATLRVFSFEFPVIEIPEVTSDKALIVNVVNVPRLSNVKAPLIVSRSGMIRPVSPETPSAVKDPLISSTLLNVSVPLAEDAMVTLPLILSQLARLLASL
jgi:hypothetical protein